MVSECFEELAIWEGHLSKVFADYCWKCFLYRISESILKLECRPMPNVMAALPNIGGAHCLTPQFG